MVSIQHPYILNMVPQSVTNFLPHTNPPTLQDAGCTVIGGGQPWEPGQ